MKGMHPTLDSWLPHRDSEGRKQDPDGLDSDLSEDNLGVRMRKLWGKLLDCPARGMPQKRVNLRRSEQRNVGFLTYRFLSY